MSKTTTIIRKRFRFKPKQQTGPAQLRINDGIRVPVVFVIDDEGKQLGEMSTLDAMALARERMLDLVEVSPKAQPPVCRIMDYGKHLYQQSKQLRLAKAKQKKVEIKGVRLGLRTDTHDVEFKRAQSEKFLKQGDKVKIDIVLRGREKAHQDLARKNLQDFITGITVPYKIEDPIKRFPGGFNVIIAPTTITE
ncbi:MAG TPA: translation initiation factor IF-3 [Candidatus Moranbacteria bacterium]|nr:translation initiation factor IF-3 [Candidatus Moranbacteria bacterium]HBT46091.1 translation initiation factor IF-3 [Candidatus Moranbacteria bacterium]